MSQGYICCFCGQGIEPIPPDVGRLIYTTCFDMSINMQVDQQFYCHAECLRSRFFPLVHLYAAEILVARAIDTGFDRSDDE